MTAEDLENEVGFVLAADISPEEPLVTTPPPKIPKTKPALHTAWQASFAAAAAQSIADAIPEVFSLPEWQIAAALTALIGAAASVGKGVALDIVRSARRASWTGDRLDAWLIEQEQKLD